MTRKPRVNPRCVANSYAAPYERIIEVSGADGAGCLISIVQLDTGRLSISVYRQDRCEVHVSTRGAAK